MTSVASQARQPHGFVGWLFGHVMAYLNDGMNRKAVELLEVRPTDRVLEIGFGHGKTIGLLARRARDGFVAGIDPSAVMVRQAAWRNQELIRAGCVEVKLASVSNLPYADAEFDKVCAVNSYQFWPDPEEDLKEVRRVLRPGGRLVLTVRAKEGSRLGLTPEQLGDIEQLVRRAGFQDVALRVQKVRFMTAANVVAKNV
jgi:ubiquinone/menaquinone biosynthesis C-methylase UbiE